MFDFRAQPPQSRLQVLLAKIKLSASEIEAANELLSQLSNWEQLTDTALRKFGLPLIRHNLGLLDRSLVPDHIMQMIDGKTNVTALHNLTTISAQKQFLEKCLDPLGIPGIFFKGVTMAAEYYPDIGLRPARDVDILVPPGTQSAIIKQAISNGYLLVSSDGQVKNLTSQRDINAVRRFSESATIVMPGGFVIDLQERLDKHSGIFSNYDIFGRSEKFSLGGGAFQTMPFEFLFNYLCHHHARHTWANLHWLSDLDAMATSDRFDRDRVLDLAEELGQTGTVEASLELHQLMSTDTPWDNGDTLYRGKQFLSLCLRNLPGKLSLEKRVSLGLVGGEFMYPWQARRDLVEKARRGRLCKVFQPTLVQYVNRPLPEPLQWWYYVPRFAALLQHTYSRQHKEVNNN